MALEIRNRQGGLRDLATFSDAEIASLTPERRELAHALITAQAKCKEIDDAVGDANRIIADLQRQRADYQNKFGNRFKRSFMDEWKSVLGSRHNPGLYAIDKRPVSK